MGSCVTCCAHLRHSGHGTRDLGQHWGREVEVNEMSYSSRREYMYTRGCSFLVDEDVCDLRNGHRGSIPLWRAIRDGNAICRSSHSNTDLVVSTFFTSNRSCVRASSTAEHNDDRVSLCH